MVQHGQVVREDVVPHQVLHVCGEGFQRGDGGGAGGVVVQDGAFVTRAVVAAQRADLQQCAAVAVGFEIEDEDGGGRRVVHGSDFFQFGIGQYQPFFARVREVDEGAQVFAVAFECHHAAFAEFGVAHAVAELVGRGGAGGARGGAVHAAHFADAAIDHRPYGFGEFFRDFVDEA